MSAAKIPTRYRFTESDYAKSLEINFRYFSDDEQVSNAVTESELHFMALAMQFNRDRTQERRTYHSILIKHRFLDYQSDEATAFAMYQRVAEEKIIVKISKSIERPKYRMAS